MDGREKKVVFSLVKIVTHQIPSTIGTKNWRLRSNKPFSQTSSIKILDLGLDQNAMKFKLQAPKMFFFLYFIIDIEVKEVILAISFLCHYVVCFSCTCIYLIVYFSHSKLFKVLRFKLPWVSFYLFFISCTTNIIIHFDAFLLFNFFIPDFGWTKSTWLE